MKRYLLLILTGILLTASSCNMQLGEQPCPYGAVTLSLYAEKFRNSDPEDAMNDTEADFYSRIGNLQYFLYRNGKLAARSKTDISGLSAFHALSFDELEYGDYRIVLVGNCKTNNVDGDPNVCSTLKLRYPGFRQTEDFFYRVFDFTVDSEDEKRLDVGMFRAHGFTRVTFENLPAFINKFRIRIENIAMEKEIERDYITNCSESNDFEVSNSPGIAPENYLVGTFPSLAGLDSPVYIDLYHENDPDDPYLTQPAGTNLKMVRNQMLNLHMKYNNGSVTIDVSMDTDWDGSLFPGGGPAEID